MVTLSKKQRSELRLKFGGRCAYCGCSLAPTGWHADHVIAVWRDSKWVPSSWELGRYVPGKYVANGKVLRPEHDVLANLFPACRPCNIDKGASKLGDWRKWLQNRMISSMRANIPNFRHAERFKRLVVVSTPLVFWFETYELEGSNE